jgi:MOSC domain-containing protein YiiM
LSNYRGEVVALFLSEKGNSERIPKVKIELDKKGVLGDKFYDKDANRSVLLTSSKSYELAKNHKIFMDYGTLGENILVDCTPYKLSVGSQLQLGNVIIEIAQNCTICNHLSIVDKHLPKLLKDDRGIFVKVIKEGVIKKGDKIYLLD